MEPFHKCHVLPVNNSFSARAAEQRFSPRSLTSPICTRERAGRYVRLDRGSISDKLVFWRKGHQIMCASKFQPCPRYFQGDAITAAGLPGGVGLEGQRAVEEIDRLEKGTLSHLSFVFPIRGLQCCPVVGDNIIKHDRLPSL